MKKTIKEHLEDLPEPYRTQALRNMSEGCADEVKEDQSKALEDLKKFARNNCREWNTDQMEEIIDRL